MPGFYSRPRHGQISKNNEDGRIFYSPGPGAFLTSVQISKGAGLEIEVLLVNGDRVVDALPIAARGRIW